MNTNNENVETETINEQFQKLSANFTAILHAAWNRPERQKLQSEIEAGLDELGHALRKITSEFQASDLGQQLITKATDVRVKIEQGTLEEKLHIELNQILKNVNRELENFVAKINQDDNPSESSEPIDSMADQASEH